MLVNFILHFFLEILQRFCEVGILGNFGRPGHAHNDWMVLYRRIVWCYLHAKNQLHPSFLFWDIAKKVQTCYVGYFGHVWLWPVKNDTTSLEKTLMFIFMQKNHIFPSPLFFKYYNNIACLAIPLKRDSSNLQETLMFICKPNINLIHQFFLEILHFKNSCNLIDQEHFGW